MTHKIVRILSLAAFGAAFSALPAGAVSLESLLAPGASFTDNGVLFSSFSYSISCSSGVGSGTTVAQCEALEGSSLPLITGIDPNSINITPDATGGLAGWTLTGGPTVYEYDGVPTTLDITLTYDATVVGSPNLIEDVELGAAAALNPACTTSSTSCPPIPSVSIGETVDTLGGSFLGSLQVTDPPPSLSDQITISPVSGIFVSKDIDLNSGAGTSGGTNDYANVTTITQQLSQVPEPRAYALAMGLFIAALFVIKRRRQQTA